MPQLAIPNDVYVGGNLSAQTMTLPANSITDAAVKTASPPSGSIAATKLIHRREEIYSQESATTVVSGAYVKKIIRGTTATLLDFKAGSVVINVGAATIVVDLLKNGTTILTATITLNSSSVAYALTAEAGSTST